MTTSVGHFTLELGAVVRKSAIWSLTVAAQKHGLALKEVSNDGGWLSRAYLFRIEGPRDKVQSFRRWLHQFAEEMADDGDDGVL